MLSENGPEQAMPFFRDPRWGRLRRLVEKLDLLYVVPVVIAVAAFIIAVLGYFGDIR
jgi:hypothetical protein